MKKCFKSTYEQKYIEKKGLWKGNQESKFQKRLIQQQIYIFLPLKAKYNKKKHLYIKYKIELLNLFQFSDFVPDRILTFDWRTGGRVLAFGHCFAWCCWRVWRGLVLMFGTASRRSRFGRMLHRLIVSVFKLDFVHKLAVRVGVERREGRWAGRRRRSVVPTWKIQKIK